MATGASTADLALVVLDVAHGLKEQTRRHLCIAALLGVHSVIVCVNKMDGVNWSRSAFQSVVDEIETLSRELGFDEVKIIPVSALFGDNVVEPSTKLALVRRPHRLSGPGVVGRRDVTKTRHGARLPIQWVLRQAGGGRTYAGMVNGDSFFVGDTVTLLPANVETTIKAISFGGVGRIEANVGLSIDLDLTDEPTPAGAISWPPLPCPPSPKS